MTHHDFTDLYGPSLPFSEHKEGTEITFRHGSEIKQGKIKHVRAPGPAIVDGKEHPLLYIVDTGQGMPVSVSPTQVVYGPFTVILASYGVSLNGCELSRKAAENLATNVEGQIITLQDGRRLRVLSARMEGDDQQGQVMAEVEAVGDEEQGEA